MKYSLTAIYLIKRHLNPYYYYLQLKTQAAYNNEPNKLSPGVDCRPAMWQSVGREYTSNIRWNIRNAVRLMSKAFLAVDSGACAKLKLRDPVGVVRRRGGRARVQGDVPMSHGRDLRPRARQGVQPVPGGEAVPTRGLLRHSAVVASSASITGDHLFHLAPIVYIRRLIVCLEARSTSRWSACARGTTPRNAPSRNSSRPR
eukprot:3176631-Pyramimonas_sp.AAC.1